MAELSNFLSRFLLPHVTPKLVCFLFQSQTQQIQQLAFSDHQRKASRSICDCLEHSSRTLHDDRTAMSVSQGHSPHILMFLRFVFDINTCQYLELLSLNVFAPAKVGPGADGTTGGGGGGSVVSCLNFAACNRISPLKGSLT